jgi:hypothetical protein
LEDIDYAADESPTWSLGAAYGLEFAAAGAGTAVAAAGAACLHGAAWSRDWYLVSIAAVPAYAVSSACLSALGTHLTARALGCESSFGRALAGGALGGVAGTALLFVRAHPRAVVEVPALVLPPLFAVAIYNMWR